MTKNGILGALFRDKAKSVQRFDCRIYIYTIEYIYIYYDFHMVQYHIEFAYVCLVVCKNGMRDLANC